MVTAKKNWRKLYICNILLRKYTFSCKARPLGIKYMPLQLRTSSSQREVKRYKQKAPSAYKAPLWMISEVLPLRLQYMHRERLCSQNANERHERREVLGKTQSTCICKSRKFVRNSNLSSGIREASFKMRDNAFKGVSKRKLSGEIFKEKEIDILQTSLEQIAFSLESHKTSDPQLYKATPWKKLRNDVNRRLPYFTKRKSSLPSCFSNVTRKFSMSELQSSLKPNFRSTYLFSCLQIVFAYSKRVRHTLLSPKHVQSKNFGLHLIGNKSTASKKPTICPQSTHRRLRASPNHVHPKVSAWNAKGIAFKKICSCHAKSPIWPGKKVLQIPHLPKLLGIGQQERYVHAKDRSFPFTTKKQYKKEKSQSTSFSFTIKIGDYLSSGDKIGEKKVKKGQSIAKQPKQSFVRSALAASRTSSSLLAGGFNPHARDGRVALRASKGEGYLSTASKKPTICSCNTFGCGLRPKSSKCKSHLSEKSSQNFVTSKTEPIVLSSSGRVIAISKSILILQKTQPVLFYNSASLHVKKGEWVSQGSPILTLTHQTLITGDIVQGIPRIEQLFEAFTSPPPAFKDKRVLTKFKNVHDTLHSQVRDIFRKYWLRNVLPIAVRKSLEEIGYILVEMIQKVYLSQGVLIADKHIEIIIRQIASKGQILDSGSTGLFLEEILPIQQIENANLTTAGKKCLYVPAVMGLTAAALNSDSFISAASFQETTRVLSRDAVVGKSDFLRGLKEKVVIGDLISAGTGLDIYFIYNTMTIVEGK